MAKDVSPLILVNPYASQIAHGGRPCAELELVSRDSGARLVYPRGEAALAQELSRYLDEASGGEGAHPGKVLLVGGDGTHRLGVTLLHRALGDRPWPAVGLVPAGNVNTTARNWGITGGAPHALRRLLTSRDEPVLKASLRVIERGEPEGGPEHVGFTWGAGLVASFFERYNATAGGVGPAARLALRIAAGALVGTRLAREVLASTPMELTVDGRPIDRNRYSLAVASVHRSVGLGIQVTYRADHAPGKFHLVASSAGPLELGLLGPRTLLGRPLGGQTVDELAERVEVRFLERGSSILDGDWLDAPALELRPGPSIPMLVPRRRPSDTDPVPLQ